MKRQEAIEFAREAHAGQVRDHSGDPYVVHPLRVADRVASIPGASEAMVVAAVLHDVVEDSDVSLAEIAERFGADVARIVDGLSSKEDKSLRRVERKAAEVARLAAEPAAVQSVKLADRIDNLRDFPVDVKKVRRFLVKAYLPESAVLLDSLVDADAGVRAELGEVIAAVREAVEAEG